MEDDNNCLDENTEDGNQMERSTPGSEQVTESGTPSEYSEIWNEFKCVFCNQDVKHMTNPKLLTCLHTACESCLTSEANGESSPSSTGAKLYQCYVEAGVKKYKKKKRTSLKTVKQISCPACSQEINVDEAVDHLFLMEYAQSSESLPEESSCYPCTSCEEGNEGTAFCQDCQEWLCETCVNAHHRVRVTKDHVVRPKEEMEGENAAIQSQKYLLCPVHPNEHLKVYCESCDKLTCRDCQLSDHKSHKYQFLRNACDEEKDNIALLLGQIKEKQGLMEEAGNSLNKRHEEIVDRESQISQEIQVFGIKFITDINKRAKALLQDLNKVCTDKKNLINVKSQELKALSERLKHCQKFAEAAIALGSETALVYSKKPIMSQLRQILKHKCEVPNPKHMVDIQFIYETNFLSQYISNLGNILVDQQPLPGSANASGMLPMPQAVPVQSPVPPAAPVRHVSQMQINQRATIPVQQMNHQQPQIGPYGQPQVTSSTDLVRNNNPQLRQMMNSQMNYRARGPVPNQQANFQMQNNPNQFNNPRQMVHQQSPQIQMRQRPQQVQQQAPQQQVQQSQLQQQQQQQYSSSNQLPIHLRQNKSISVTTLPSPSGPSASGPSPSKQRAIAPRANLTMNNQGNTVQRVNNSQANQGRQVSGQPQLIVLDDNNQKTPNMSNTTRLSHFPTNLAAIQAANPSLQIQPATNNNYSNLQPAFPGVSVSQFPHPSSCLIVQNSPTIVNHLLKPTVNNKSFSIAQSPMHSSVLDMHSSLQQIDSSSFSNEPNSIQLTMTTLSTPTVSSNSSAESIQILEGNQLSSETPCLKQLLLDDSAPPIEAISPQSSESSSDSLPSLASLMNSQGSPNISIAPTMEAKPESCSKTSNENSTDSKSTDSSNFSELTSSFLKHCSTSDHRCVVCKEAKDLVLCTKCQKAYHTTCHIPMLVSSKNTESHWVCMLCRDVLTYPLSYEDLKKKHIDLHGRELMICERILLEVFIHPKSWYFHQKVSRRVPNYYKIIKRPMDFSTIRMKLSPTHFEHYKDVEEFCDDVRLVFDNCFIFNSVGSDVHNAGKEIQDFFEATLSQYFPELTLADNE